MDSENLELLDDLFDGLELEQQQQSYCRRSTASGIYRL
jgi:hypothetical protein